MTLRFCFINLCQRGIVPKAVEWISRQRLETWRCWKRRRSAGQKPQDWYNARQPGSGRPRTTHSGRGPRVQLGRQAKKAPISSWDFAWSWHFTLKCAQDNSPLFPAQMRQTTTCSAVVWSQSCRPSHSLINNLIICNKSCYCSIINRELNNT